MECRQRNGPVANDIPVEELNDVVGLHRESNSKATCCVQQGPESLRESTEENQATTTTLLLSFD